MFDTMCVAVRQFALSESGRIEQQRALPFAWTAGLMVGAVAVVSAPGVAEAGMCDERFIVVDACMEDDCDEECGDLCMSRCADMHHCECY